MLSYSDEFALVIFAIAYAIVAFEKYESFARQTNQKLGSALCALAFPITAPIITIITIYRTHKRYKKQ